MKYLLTCLDEWPIRMSDLLTTSTNLTNDQTLLIYTERTDLCIAIVYICMVFMVLYDLYIAIVWEFTLHCRSAIPDIEYIFCTTIILRLKGYKFAHHLFVFWFLHWDKS